MKYVEFTDPHRCKHFEFFKRMSHPHFSVCGNVHIGDLVGLLKGKQVPFMPAVAWVVSKVANEIPEFRRRIRGEQVVEHEAVHPSFSIITKVSDVFSFCEVKYGFSFGGFMERAQAKIADMQTAPSFEDEPGRDDFLFLSTFPWVSFTAVQHAMDYHPHDSVPRIVWGKYFEENGIYKMPLSVQAHHALVDGRHIGQYFERFEQLCLQPEQWISS
jgi:chloramphenicol O-acetyltransferase type A